MMTHDAALRRPPRPVIDYAPAIWRLLKEERRARFKARAIDAVCGLAVVVVMFAALNIVRVVESYGAALEREAALKAEVVELRARAEAVDNAEPWACRDMGTVRDGTRFRWCSQKVRP